MTYPYLLKSFELIHSIYNSQLTLLCAVVMIIILNIFPLKYFCKCSAGDLHFAVQVMLYKT